MKIRLKMFAILRERSGVGETELELPAGATVSQARAAVQRRFAGLGELLPRAAVAVNLNAASDAAILHEGDELALIPPVSGG
jgi:molybdopterin converting factor subunit 1